MGSTEQTQINDTLAVMPPKDGVLLVGWVVMAEWIEPGGDRFISRLLCDGSTPWQAKGYLFEGLNGVWPSNPGHHNPGHPAGWMRVERDKD
jgi:hypothetical protein